MRDVDDIEKLVREGTLVHGRLIGHVFSTTDYVMDAYGEDSSYVCELIKARQIILKNFDSYELMGIQKILDKYRTVLSIADCSAIHHARTTDGLLLTDDKVLTKICGAVGIRTNTYSEYLKQINFNQKTNENKKQRQIKTRRGAWL